MQQFSISMWEISSLSRSA